MTEQTIASFLKQLRKTSGFSANEVVEKLKTYNIDISAKTLYGYESGLSMLNADVFVALCRIYRCDNPMELFGNCSITSEEYRHIKKYRSLDSIGQETVDFIIEREIFNTEARETAKKRLLTYAETLKKVQDNKSPLDQGYPILDAAHERTDIEITDEMRKNDDNIMDDENF